MSSEGSESYRKDEVPKKRDVKDQSKRKYFNAELHKINDRNDDYFICP